jgi:hypothetical protein
MMLTAGTTLVLWQPKTLKVSPAQARDMLMVGDDDEQRRAIVVLMQDARRTMAALRAVEEAGGTPAVHARNALDSLAQLNRSYGR